MDDIVERIARASFAWWKQQNSRVADFEDMNPDELEFAMGHARAILKAMREPTDEMVAIGSSGPAISKSEALAAWWAMIDAAAQDDPMDAAITRSHELMLLSREFLSSRPK